LQIFFAPGELGEGSSKTKTCL